MLPYQNSKLNVFGRGLAQHNRPLHWEGRSPTQLERDVCLRSRVSNAQRLHPSYTSHITNCKGYLQKLVQEQSNSRPGWEQRRQGRVRGAAAIRATIGDLNFDTPNGPLPQEMPTLRLEHNKVCEVPPFRKHPQLTIFL